MLLSMICLAIMLLALAVGWVALETRRVHRAIDLYREEMRQWSQALQRMERL